MQLIDEEDVWDGALVLPPEIHISSASSCYYIRSSYNWLLESFVTVGNKSLIFHIRVLRRNREEVLSPSPNEVLGLVGQNISDAQKEFS